MDKSVEITKEVLVAYNLAIRELVMLVRDNAANGNSVIESEKIIEIVGKARGRIEQVLDDNLTNLIRGLEG